MGTEQQRRRTEAQLRQLPRQATYRPGDRLPGERELVAALGVGRTARRVEGCASAVPGWLRTRTAGGRMIGSPVAYLAGIGGSEERICRRTQRSHPRSRRTGGR